MLSSLPPAALLVLLVATATAALLRLFPLIILRSFCSTCTLHLVLLKLQMEMHNLLRSEVLRHGWRREERDRNAMH